ncbi:hypothetical protein HPHPH27_0501 [Helicobacter pylori Hp H-27]|uniref:Uncharacterized protein n=1 Tax=Helicobacter pylori Hp P-15 TaxID=992080 RepID=J0F8T4_HELPX|nr:hypothetical protein HPHPH27_0501 [Helicobacter pylori Hp H-27]EJC08539.1 hypothetical protein HPHPP15_0504 [Helicobacter pylori Hp P-15]EJC15876.1 hypothetical protein HPHPP74_0677 [Helicobacter pylori Hp P-74]EJC33128.1 hypothetical protein HPHPP15B_0506 [Helicobacter pylori Hp P-15b]
MDLYANFVDFKGFFNNENDFLNKFFLNLLKVNLNGLLF